MTVLQISQLPSKFSRARKKTWKEEYSQNDITEILYEVLITNKDIYFYASCNIEVSVFQKITDSSLMTDSQFL